MHLRRFFAAFGVVLVLAGLHAPAGEIAKPPLPRATFKNIIVFMPDGCGTSHMTLTRWFKGGLLNLDRMHLAGVQTFGAESIITDSAPAATAFACGVKTSDKMLGVLPDKTTVPGVFESDSETRTKPVASVLEAARLAGRSTGLVSTSNIQHASPAGYSAHWPVRSDYNEIAEQQVYGNFDVVLGGGEQYLLPKSAGGQRTDGENLTDVLKDRGYSYVRTAAEMNAAHGERLWGMFAADAMAYEMDRLRQAPDQPSLAQMTAKALEILSKNPNGFFLFVEGSKIDWASHANDPAGVISDMLAFDEAAGLGLNYAEQHGDTLVVAFSDHGNGGLSIGNTATDATYSKLPPSVFIDPLKKAELTGEGLEMELGANPSVEKVTAVMSQFFGVTDLTAEEIEAIRQYRAGSLNYVAGPVISKRAKLGWTTTGHTGEDLFFYHYGLNKPLGMIDNTDIAKLCANALDLSLEDITGLLFQRADVIFPAFGIQWSVDNADPANPVIIARKGLVSAEIPVSKSVMTIYYPGGMTETRNLKGITVFAPKTGRYYVPGQVLSPFVWNMKNLTPEEESLLILTGVGR